MNLRPISALFVSGRSIYKHLPGVEAFDRKRGVQSFDGKTPIIAHPPCRCWSKYFASQARPVDREAEMELGRWAVRTVMQCGGVLEQPAKSALWEACQLPGPGDRSDPFCYTVYVEQSWFGFPTPKPTWLLVCGVPPGSLPAPPMRLMNHSRMSFNRMSQFNRSRTLQSFAGYLCQIARATWWSLPCQFTGRQGDAKEPGRKGGAKALASTDAKPPGRSNRAKPAGLAPTL